MKHSPVTEGRAPLPELDEVLELLRLVWAVDHGLQSASKRMEARLGVTGPQRLVLRIIGRFPGLTAGQLADVLHVHPSTVSGLLKRLERRRLITRRVDPKDKRRASLGLSEAGRALDTHSEGTVEASVRDAVLRLSPQKRKVASEVLRVLAEALGRTETALHSPQAAVVELRKVARRGRRSG